MNEAGNRRAVECVRGKGFSVWALGPCEARTMSRFVYEAYRERFGKHGTLGTADFVKMACDDVSTRRCSLIFAAVARPTRSDVNRFSLSRCLGALRITEKQGVLPVERDFEIDTLLESAALLQELGRPARVNRIFEIGRFVTSAVRIQRAGFPRSRSIHIADALLTAMFQAVSREADNVGVASLDVDVVRILRLRGIHFRSIGAAAEDYLGSPTVPVVLPVDICREEMQRSHPKLHRKFFGPVWPDLPPARSPLSVALATGR